jgi:CXXX repeat modification system protein
VLKGKEMETSCGKVTEAERDEIRRLFQRKLALTELFQALAKMDSAAMERLYERALADMGKVSDEFHSWWNATAKKYSWPAANGGSWRIDFVTCEVHLVQ